MRVRCSLAVLLWLLLTLGCNGLFYQPSRRLLGWPAQPFRDVVLHARDGAKLHGWLFPQRGDLEGTFVQFHGNAGNVSTHYESLLWVTEHGYQLLCFDYRGYGKSPGYPYPEGLRQDALAAMSYAASLPHGTQPADLIFYGQSLGGAVLLDAFGQLDDTARVRLLVVEGSFHSYQEVAASVLWRRPLLFPLTGFAYATLSEEHAPAPAIPKVSPVPLLVIHGAEDRIIPPAFGRTIHALARPPRELWIVPGGGHIDAMRRPELRQRLMALVAGAPQPTR